RGNRVSIRSRTPTIRVVNACSSRSFLVACSPLAEASHVAAGASHAAVPDDGVAVWVDARNQSFVSLVSAHLDAVGSGPPLPALVFWARACLATPVMSFTMTAITTRSQIICTE